MAGGRDAYASERMCTVRVFDALSVLCHHRKSRQDASQFMVGQLSIPRFTLQRPSVSQPCQWIG